MLPNGGPNAQPMPQRTAIVRFGPRHVVERLRAMAARPPQRRRGNEKRVPVLLDLDSRAPQGQAKVPTFRIVDQKSGAIGRGVDNLAPRIRCTRPCTIDPGFQAYLAHDAGSREPRSPVPAKLVSWFSGEWTCLKTNVFWFVACRNDKVGLLKQ